MTALNVGHKILVMSEERPGGRRRRVKASRAQDASPSLAAADFKARCLELMDRVCETGVEYTITKHGRPVARLVPYEPSTTRRL